MNTRGRNIYFTKQENLDFLFFKSTDALYCSPITSIFLMNELYSFTVPIFIKSLGGLKTVLMKAGVHAQQIGITEESLLKDQLAPDMFPLVKQVQVACNNAKDAVARLTGTEAPTFLDTEETISDLLHRIDATVTFLQSLPESAFTDAATRHVILPYFPNTYMTGFNYVHEYALPNFFFHTVIAYGIIRKNGVPIGKADYANGLTLQPL